MTYQMMSQTMPDEEKRIDPRSLIGQINLWNERGASRSLSYERLCSRNYITLCWNLWQIDQFVRRQDLYCVREFKLYRFIWFVVDNDPISCFSLSCAWILLAAKQESEHLCLKVLEWRTLATREGLIAIDRDMEVGIKRDKGRLFKTLIPLWWCVWLVGWLREKIETYHVWRHAMRISMIPLGVDGLKCSGRFYHW